jgi:hypothetical protein
MTKIRLTFLKPNPNGNPVSEFDDAVTPLINTGELGEVIEEDVQFGVTCYEVKFNSLKQSISVSTFDFNYEVLQE